MKKMLIAILVLSSFSTYAGRIVNKKTYEFIELNLDRDTKVLEILSSTPLVGDFSIPLTKTPKQDSLELSYYTVTESVADNLYDNPGQIILLPFTVAFDTLILPIGLTAELIKNGQYRKDHRTLMRAIQTDDKTEIKVSRKRFERIANSLKGTYGYRIR